VGTGPHHPHARLKRSWQALLRAGTGSLVVAAAVVSAPPADAKQLDAHASLSDKVEKARAALQKPLAPDPQLRSAEMLAWWGNRWGNGGWGYHPYWHNWPNWHNWHNWHNWGNW
jgi:hypothetical protein